MAVLGVCPERCSAPISPPTGINTGNSWGPRPPLPHRFLAFSLLTSDRRLRSSPGSEQGIENPRSGNYQGSRRTQSDTTIKRNSVDLHATALHERGPLVHFHCQKDGKLLRRAADRLAPLFRELCLEVGYPRSRNLEANRDLGIRAQTIGEPTRAFESCSRRSHCAGETKRSPLTNFKQC